MHRLPAFLIVGPVLSGLAFTAVFSPRPLFANLAAQGWNSFLYSVLFWAGMVLLPMLALSGVDYKLSHYRWRIPVSGLAGFVLTVVVIYCFALEDGSEAAFEKFRRNWFLIGLTVGGPAAVSSWLTRPPAELRQPPRG